MRREGFKPTSTSYVCSKHFLDSDFTVPNIFKKKRLLNGVPSVNLRGNEVDEGMQKHSGWAFSANRNVQATIVEQELPNALEIQVSGDVTETSCPVVVSDSHSQSFANGENLQALNFEIQRLKFVNESWKKVAFYLRTSVMLK